MRNESSIARTKCLVPQYTALPGTDLVPAADDAKLISGLKNHTYQLVVLHTQPDDQSIFYQKYFDEHLYISIPKTHPLASHKEVSFADLSGMSILAHSSSGFWIDICKKNLKDSKLLIQDSIDALHEIIDYSSLPAFHSDRAVEHGYTADDRIVIPVNDKAAHVTYYLACMNSEVLSLRAILCSTH